MTPTRIEDRTHYERLACGADVYVVRTTTPDLVVCRIALPGGELATGGRDTLALLQEELMPTGMRGCVRGEVRMRLDALGAHTSFESDATHFLVSLTVRREHFEAALQLIVEMLAAPVVRPREYAEAVSHLDTVFTHRAEDTSALASCTLLQTLYRRGHPHWIMGHEEARAELMRVRSADVLSFHAETLSAVGALVCVAGDGSPRTLLAATARACAALPHARPLRTPEAHPEYTNDTYEHERVVSVPDKLNIDTLAAVPLALTRESNELAALQLAVAVLGGSSTSRLFHTLRTEHSYTYGAYARLAGIMDGYPGYLSVRSVFPAPVFSPARVALKAVVERWAGEGITARELATRKEELCGSYVVGLASTASMCGALFSALLMDKPLSYLDTYRERVNALTRAEVNRAIRTHVDPSLMAVVAAGAVDAAGKPL